MITGRCMCGETRYEVASGMLWTALCHCVDCQRAAGADYVSWFGVETEQTRWSGPLRSHRSSPGVTRTFCDTCGTPMSFESDKFPGETHLYAPSLNDRSQYSPGRHIFWSERVPWLEGSRDLPVHEKGYPAANET